MDIANEATLANELFRRGELDVLALQEVPFDASGGSQLLDRLAGESSLRHVATHILSSSSFFPDASAGVAVASRFPMETLARHRLPNPCLVAERGGRKISSHEKGALSVRLRVVDVDICFTTVHMLPFHVFGRSASEPSFSEIWSSLCNLLDSFDGAPTVLAGDLNTTKRDLIFTEVANPLESALDGTPTHRGWPVDDILYSRHFLMKKVGVAESSSDHAICRADLELK